MYDQKTDLRRQGLALSPKTTEAARRQLKQAAIEIWSEDLLRPRAGVRAVQAIQPVLQDWLSRKPGLSYRVVQVLTGHGCFGEYLHDKARKEPSRRCHHCAEVRDTAQHTVEFCPAWADQRRALTSAIGGDLGLPSMVKAMLESQQKWEAVASFCEEVLTRKEAAEREREADPNAPPMRRRRVGPRGRRFAAQAAIN
ncbi:uncharacterized protein LOC114941449 [Nylanderia fulva]|uniref:uncharacterized protein LOC114941449 n=1 Tax=Nylanderia fulva TaxID=613905 RepID=UPI0010FAF24D|nr:uncharacterized protein LOC114941449 [Nylanderia fulva]